jgi:hypothetical protein
MEGIAMKFKLSVSQILVVLLMTALFCVNALNPELSSLSCKNNESALCMIGP